MKNPGREAYFRERDRIQANHDRADEIVAELLERGRSTGSLLKPFNPDGPGNDYHNTVNKIAEQRPSSMEDARRILVDEGWLKP